MFALYSRLQLIIWPALVIPSYCPDPRARFESRECHPTRVSLPPRLYELGPKCFLTRHRVECGLIQRHTHTHTDSSQTSRTFGICQLCIARANTAANILQFRNLGVFFKRLVFDRQHFPRQILETNICPNANDFLRRLNSRIEIYLVVNICRQIVDCSWIRDLLGYKYRKQIYKFIIFFVKVTRTMETQKLEKLWKKKQNGIK